MGDGYSAARFRQAGSSSESGSTPERARIAEAGVVNQDQQHIRRTLGRLHVAGLAPIRCRTLKRPLGRARELRPPDRKPGAINSCVRHWSTPSLDAELTTARLVPEPHTLSPRRQQASSDWGDSHRTGWWRTRKRRGRPARVRRLYAAGRGSQPSPEAIRSGGGAVPRAMNRKSFTYDRGIASWKPPVRKRS